MCISFTFTYLSKSALCNSRFHLVWSAGKIRTSGQRNHPSMEANRIYCSRLGRESFWSAYLQYNINDNPAKKHAINTTPSINFRQCCSIYIRYTTICLKTRDIDGQRYVAIFIAHLCMTYTVGFVLMCTLREKYWPNLYNLTGVRNRPLPSRPIRGQYLVPML